MSKIPSPEKAPFCVSKYAGVKAVFFENKRKRFFISSTKNTFGGFQIRTCMHDSGCNTHLLPIVSEEALSELLKLYNPRSLDYIFGFFVNNGVSGQHAIMTIKKRDQSNFSVRLCQDILGAKETAQLPTLRFYLCSFDIDFLLGSDKLTVLQQSRLSHLRQKLNCTVAVPGGAGGIMATGADGQGGRQEKASVTTSSATPPPVPEQHRRQHALLGQDILDSSINGTHAHAGVCILTDRAIFETGDLYARLEQMAVDFWTDPTFDSATFENLESDDYCNNDFLEHEPVEDV